MDSLSIIKAQLHEEAVAMEISSYRTEHSYIGYMGKAIAPVLQPLGYDWKTGIAIITSFAAREVFVGTLVTLYSIGSEETATIQERLAKEVNPVTGQPVFTLAVGVSLLLFYALAMQCLSTVAVVKQESGSWKWAVGQFVVMTLLAYLSALIAYQWLK